MASFSSKFVFEMHLCHMCVIAVPKIEWTATNETIAVMIDTGDKDAERLAQGALQYLKTRRSSNMALVLNGATGASTRLERCPSLRELEDLLPSERVVMIDIFSEENLARVAHLLIVTARTLAGH